MCCSARSPSKHSGWLRWYAFDPLALDLKATALAVIAGVLAFVFHRGLIEVVVVMAALGYRDAAACSARDQRSRLTGALVPAP